MGWIINNYIVRGIADFFIGVGLVVSQAVADPQPKIYKDIPFRNFTVSAEDGVSIAGTHLGMSFSQETGECRGVVIIIHGIAASRRHPDFMRLARDIYGKYDIIIIDLRGHGGSGGEFTGGESEVYDVRAAVDYARACGYSKIAIMGFSAGSIATVREVARNQTVKAIVLVSSISSPERVKSAGAKLLCTKSVLLQIAGKFFLFMRGSRLKVPTRVPSSLESIEKIKCPVLFIHGRNDWLIDSDQSLILHERANEPKKIIILHSAEHAEALYRDRQKEFYAAVMDWFEKYLK